tara:strand:+ start:1093 stop:2079 length:987 start_codon:yes stop_codon:yes gene_type:complete
MAIKKFLDLENETDSKFNVVKAAVKRANITERFDDSTDNDNPYDDALQYMNKKMDQCIDTINANNSASGSLETKVKSLTAASASFSTRVTANDAKTPLVIGTKSNQALRGDTVTITNDQANAITANTAKVSMVIGSKPTQAMAGNTTTISDSQAEAITTNSAKTGITTSQANAITANTAKRDARYIYFPVIANFSGNINTEQFVPLSDGETEATNQLLRRNNFIAPCAGNIHKVFVRSNSSLLTKGKGVSITAKLHKYISGTNSDVLTSTATATTGAGGTTTTIDLSDASGNSFTAGTRLLVGLQAPLNATKNYYVTVVFKLDQSDLD